MGIPMVGKRHQRQTRSSQVADRFVREIPHRVRSTGSGGRPPAHYQQSFQAQHPEQNNNQHSLGALLSRRTASQGDIHPGRVFSVRQELDSATMGISSLRRSENRRGRALASSGQNSRWKQGEDQMRDVSGVLSRSAMGVLFAQPYFFRNSGRNWRQERTECRRSRQRQTAEVPSGVVSGASGIGSEPFAISGPASRI